MSRTQKLARIKSRKEEEEQNRNKLTAKLDVIKESLKESFEVDSIKEAIPKLESMEKGLEKLTNKFDDIMSGVEQKYNDS